MSKCELEYTAVNLRDTRHRLKRSLLLLNVQVSLNIMHTEQKIAPSHLSLFINYHVASEREIKYVTLSDKTEAYAD